MTQLTAKYEDGLYAAANAHGFSQLAQDTQLNRENLYRMLSVTGNPQLSSLNALLHSVGLRLAVEVDTA